MADTIGPLRVLSTWKAAENVRYCSLLEVAQNGLVGATSLGELNRAREAVDLGHCRNYGTHVCHASYIYTTNCSDSKTMRIIVM